MFIRCWGARGSIAVSGKEYLKYGGDTTCLEIRNSKGDIIIVDAGTGIRRLGNLLIEERKKKFNIIFTHSHWDHLLGLPFFKPLYFKRSTINFYGCRFAQESVQAMIAGSMKPPYFPIDLTKVSSTLSFLGICDTKFKIGGMEISPILLSHPNKGLGYKFTENGKSFVFLTDNELGFKHPGGLDFEDYRNFCQGADLLFHDSEFTEEEYKKTRMWGHSVYNESLCLALEAGVKSFGLFHHNQERVDSAIDAIVNDCKIIIKKNKSRLKCSGVKTGMEIKL
ncbi:MBL fold metallo-hydrolase [Candidatus Riflebacteria bacterium]